MTASTGKKTEKKTSWKKPEATKKPAAKTAAKKVDAKKTAAAKKPAPAKKGKKSTKAEEKPKKKLRLIDELSKIEDEKDEGLKGIEEEERVAYLEEFRDVEVAEEPSSGEEF